jgi:hypothetical protein
MAGQDTYILFYTKKTTLCIHVIISKASPLFCWKQLWIFVYVPASLKKHMFSSENTVITQFCYDLAVKLKSLPHAHEIITSVVDYETNPHSSE